MLSRGQRHISPQGARLHWKRRPRTPRAVVLVLHGGQAHGTQPTSLTQASVLRVMPFVRAIARRGGDGVAVGFLRYAVRGWNSGGDALRDARWALSQIEAAYPDLPLGVVGYSMGGRVALYLAGECRPRAVVGLAARVLRAAGTSVEIDIVPGDTHALLRHPAYWHRRAADFVIDALGD